jgi:hypothetical protein
MKGAVGEIVFVDRYSATGTPYPDPETMCQGQCEGMGCYPCKNDDEMEQTVKQIISNRQTEQI